ncbi:MAG: SDR family oxidoreductase [Gemmatimonadales bacterium]
MNDEPTSPFRPDVLLGQRAFITGGATGIGLSIAREYVRHGASVAIASRNADHHHAAAQALEPFGTSVRTYEANVRDADSVRTAVDRAANDLGGLDVVINNAAGNFYAPSETITPNGWKAIVETDLDGTFYTSQAAYPWLQDNGGGSIISISMTLHYRGWPMMAPATAAKAGVDALTKTLALEWGPTNIRINAIAPGPIPTEGVKRAFTAVDDDVNSAIDEKLAAKIPLGRLGKPSDVAQMAVYLASDAAAWITGAIFVVDGGSWLART